MIIINLQEVLINILVDIVLEVYRSYITENKNIKYLLIQYLNTLYGTMVMSLLYYIKFTDQKISNFKLIYMICA